MRHARSRSVGRRTAGAADGSAPGRVATGVLMLLAFPATRLRSCQRQVIRTLWIVRSGQSQPVRRPAAVEDVGERGGQVAGTEPLTLTRQLADLGLTPGVVTAMRTDLARVAEQTVDVIRTEVPDYADPFRGEMGRSIEGAVQLALDGFLGAASGDTTGGSTSVERVAEAAYSLGRGEARSGRSMDALLSAYRVGARVAWRDMSDAGVRAGLPAETVARFAQLVFAYIDELSAAKIGRASCRERV